jgi:F-type H+-transporting ATPase subunit delta
MTNDKISYRYASSLIDTAESSNLLVDVSSDMELINSTLKTNPQLKRVIESPVVKSSLKRTIFTEIFKDKINPESLKFLLFIIDKTRENYLSEIIEKFLLLRDEKLGIVNVLIKVPYELDQKHIDNFREKFEMLLGKKVRLKFDVDKKLIGGFLAKVGDTVYDASFLHQLELLRKQFLLVPGNEKSSVNLN